MLTDRSELIIQYFDYLIKEFDFNIEKKKFDPGMMGNAYVIFKSSRVEIEIVIDRNQVLISLGDRKKSREKWFEYSDVLKFFAPLEVAYTDLDELFDEKRTNHTSNADTWDEVIEVQLDRLAVMLRRYCEPILKGDLSRKKDIKRIEEKRVSEMLKRLNNTSKN